MKYPWLAVMALCLSLHGALLHAAESAAPVTPPAPAEYRPSMGDLMTMAVQPRHIKLGLAGEQKNWDYAKFELSELRNAFARIARTLPTYNNTDTATMVNAMISQQIVTVQEAIAASDARQFERSYKHLTDACNACHVALNHPALVMKVPDHNAFPNQEFKSRKP